MTTIQMVYKTITKQWLWDNVSFGHEHEHEHEHRFA